MTLERLKTLPLESLQQIAVIEGINFPDNIDKESLIKVILEAIEENKDERVKHDNNPIKIIEKKYDLINDLGLNVNQPQNGDLPEGYNETQIELLVRDPEWAYTYWEIKDSLIKSLKKSPTFEGLYLRVLEYTGAGCSDNGDISKVIDRFDIPVKLIDNQWYINLPHTGARYELELHCAVDGKDDVLAKSNTITIPVGSFAQVLDMDDLDEDLIIVLSGFEGLDLSSFNNKIPHRIISLADDQSFR
jgi:uncharacterized protein